MTSSSRTDPALFPQRERWGFLGVVLLCVIAGCAIVIEGVSRLMAIIPNTDVPIAVRLVGEDVALAAGSEGADIVAQLDRAFIPMSDLTPLPYAAFITSVVVHVLCLLVVLVCVALFVLNLSRGIAFDPRNTKLLAATGILVGVGYALPLLLDRFATLRALDALGADGFQTAAEEFDVLPLVVIFGIGAIANAFALGARLQRDTEGLV